METKITEVKVHERRVPRLEYVTARNGTSKPLMRDYRCDQNEYRSSTRVYVYPQTYSVMENLVNRTSRPWKAWKPVVEAELRNAGYDGKIRWSQHAGCKMCPCSPGFVLDETLRIEGKPIDVSITVTE